MKKTSILTIGLFVLSIGLLNAQTSQGNYLLDLSSNAFAIQFMTSKTKSDSYESDADKYLTLNLSPKAGYFVIDNLAVGLGVVFTFMAYDLGNENNTRTSISAGPFVRYYVPTSTVLPFAELGCSFGTQTFNTIIQYGGGIGLAVPLTNKVMVDAMLGYQSSTYKDKDNTDNLKIIMGSLQLNIGFVIFLGSN